MRDPPAYLPAELRREILSCLPVKSLVRFTCVSKSWNSIISNSQFINLHLRRSSSRTNAASSHIHSLISSPLESPSTIVKTPDEYKFSGTCNGLICLRKSEINHENHGEPIFRVRLWNPATRSMSQHSPPLYDVHCNFGFGYDCSSDTYKVVEVSLSPEKTVNVFNMGDNCWRKIQLLPHAKLYRYGDSVYVSNTLNWLATLPDIINEDGGGELMKTDPFIIFSFDLGKENCAQLLLPYCPRRRVEFKSFVPILGVLRGSLCVCQIYQTLRYEIWQMKEFGVYESWSLLFKVTRYEYRYADIVQWPCFAMYMSKDGDALLLSRADARQSEAILYTQKVNKLEGVKNVNHTVDCYAMHYIESLVSPC